MRITVFKKELAIALMLLFLNTVLFPLSWYAPQQNVQLKSGNTIEVASAGSLLELCMEKCLGTEEDTPFFPQTPQEEETSVLNNGSLLEEFIHLERSISFPPFFNVCQLLPDFYYRAYSPVYLEVVVQPPELATAV